MRGSWLLIVRERGIHRRPQNMFTEEISNVTTSPLSCLPLIAAQLYSSTVTGTHESYDGGGSNPCLSSISRHSRFRALERCPSLLFLLFA